MPVVKIADATGIPFADEPVLWGWGRAQNASAGQFAAMTVAGIAGWILSIDRVRMQGVTVGWVDVERPATTVLTGPVSGNVQYLNAPLTVSFPPSTPIAYQVVAKQGVLASSPSGGGVLMFQNIDNPTSLLLQAGDQAVIRAAIGATACYLYASGRAWQVR